MDLADNLPLVSPEEKSAAVRTGVRGKVDARRVGLGFEVTFVPQRGKGPLKQGEMVHLKRNMDDIH